ncbi:MAG: tetratricopeptide repeat protein [Burkholderiales bacterium]|nr:tetratricopeptide repeat protein [Burkholderiales bacterium]
MAAAVLAAALALAGCTPQAQLALEAAKLLSPAFTALMNNMRTVDQPNQEKLAAFEAKQDWDGMIAFAQKNLQIDSSSGEWWTVLGYAYSQKAEYERAAAAFAEVVRNSPDEVEGYNLLAEAYRMMGQHERAIRTLDRGLRVTRDSPVTYMLIGENFNALGRPERALEYYEQALRRDNRLVPAWYGMGVAYARLGRAAEFNQVMSTLRELSPPDAARLAQLEPRAIGAPKPATRP